MIEEFGKKPRIYVNSELKEKSSIPLTTEQAHYFKNVLRRETGDTIRIFNGRDGEWLASITELKKKNGSCDIIQKIKEQPEADAPIHLLFAPIKKNRMDILIEKAVEMGVSDLHPVITDHTQNGKIKTERLTAQIIEAAEQCERLDIPKLHTSLPLAAKLRGWDTSQPLIWACERGENQALSKIVMKNWAFLIGPEGGFSEQEMETLKNNKDLTPVSLGSRIYRTETACALCLAHANLQNMA